MSEETTRRALSPPSIVDHSDDDEPDQVLDLLAKPARTNWPPSDTSKDVLESLTTYGLKLARYRLFKSIGLGIITAASAVAYTYILLSVR